MGQFGKGRKHPTEPSAFGLGNGRNGGKPSRLLPNQDEGPVSVP
jgi:hypothetical protein